MAEADGSFGPSRKLAEIGEFGLIAALAARLPSAPGVTVGIGDDSAVLAVPDGNVVAAVDFLLEGRHFRRAWSTAPDVGAKAAARSLADIAAMGAVPTALLVALALPGDLTADWPLGFADGVAAECARAGAGVIGGDIARADAVIVSVTALGSLPGGQPPVLRSGAQPGDTVAVAGPLGSSAAGLALLRAGAADFPGLIQAHLRPAPPYDAGPEAARLGATAMIDTSDGLLADLGHVASASGVAIDISTAALGGNDVLAAAASSVFSHPEISSEKRRADLAPHVLAWVLTGGEDHSLAATFPASRQLPPRWRPIGSVLAGSGITVDGSPYQGPAGWEHFR